MQCFGCSHCFGIWCILRCGACQVFRQHACLTPAGSSKALRHWGLSIWAYQPGFSVRQRHAFHWLRPLWTSVVNRSRAPRRPPRSPPPLRSKGTSTFLNSQFPSVESICVSSSPLERILTATSPEGHLGRLPPSAGSFWKS